MIHRSKNIPVIYRALHRCNHVFSPASLCPHRVGIRGGRVRGSEPKFDVGGVDDAGVAVDGEVDGAGFGWAGAEAGAGGM